MTRNNNPIDRNQVLMYVRDKAVVRHPLKLGKFYAVVKFGQQEIGGSGDGHESAYQDLTDTICKSEKYLTAFKRLKR